MADTPEELARRFLTERSNPNWARHHSEALIQILREAEARGFAKGLEAAAQECVSMYEATPGVPSNLRLATAAARIRALAPKAPPEVAAAEPKP